MNISRTFALCCVALYTVNTTLTNQPNDLHDFNQEIRQELQNAQEALPEFMNLLNDVFNAPYQSTSYSSINNNTCNNELTITPKDNTLEISVAVQNVENSEKIHAQANIAQGRLKIIIPQKNCVTKLIIQQDTIKKIVKQQSQHKHEGKNRHSYQEIINKQIEQKSLPFPVDITERTVEYKDNGTLSIILNKAKNNQPTIQKAQPRIIPVVNK